MKLRKQKNVAKIGEIGWKMVVTNAITMNTDCVIIKIPTGTMFIEQVDAKVHLPEAKNGRANADGDANINGTIQFGMDRLQKL